MERIKFRDWTHLLGQIHGSNTYVNVWNCRAEFVINNIYESDIEDKLTEEQKEALERLKNYIVYTVNDGALNFSGQYQLDELSFELLGEILQGNTDIIETIEAPSEQEIKAKAEEIILALREGEYVVVRDSSLDYGCWGGCQGYHNVQYVAMLKKLVLVDNGNAHHALASTAGQYEILREISEQEAIEMLTKYIEQVAEKENYTKVELENYVDDSDFTGKMKICEKHSEIYFEHEECRQCYEG